MCDGICPFRSFTDHHTFTLGRTPSLTGSAARPRFIPGRYLFFFLCQFAFSFGKRMLPGGYCLPRNLQVSGTLKWGEEILSIGIASFGICG